MPSPSEQVPNCCVVPMRLPTVTHTLAAPNALSRRVALHAVNHSRSVSCHAHALQDVTVRQLGLNLWGSSCGYTAQNNAYPGAWLGPATVSILPYTCSSLFSPQGVAYTFGTTSGTPNVVMAAPPFAMQVSMQSVDGSQSGLASGGQIVSYLQVLGTSALMTNLTGSADDSLTWLYMPPPALQVAVVPVGGCADGSSTCLTPLATCSGASGANSLTASILNAWDLSNVEGNAPSTYSSQVGA